MIRLPVAIVIFILSFAAYAQERVVIGTQRLSENGALFLAAAQGYFKAEGIDLAMTAYDSDKTVAEMLASGATDFGLARFTPVAFDAAGKDLIRAIAAQAREKRDYEGSQLVASSIGFQKGLRKFDNLAGKTVAIDALGSTAHYQLLQIAYQTCRSGTHHRQGAWDA
ncbi:MAG TPA: ABC transporter substrate-binding protein [Pseudolabrys sp.]|nr:ABC transporter substrate-binding protein [Pseudolabrys sp.]